MISKERQSVIIVAGGTGSRVGGDIPKQFISIDGKPMLMHTIESFYNYHHTLHIIVVLPQDFLALWQQLCNEYNFRVVHTVVIGGETRFHSVRNGLKEVSAEDIVAVHDGARPFVSPELIESCFIESYKLQCGVIPVIDEVNSVRKLTVTGSEIINREEIKIVQTPQVFPGNILKKSYEAEYEASFTDDASVAEKSGFEIKLIPGENTNIKITTSLDFEFAEHLIKKLTKR